MNIRIKKIKRIANNSLRYDIETKQHHNFFANNILVHNSSITMVIDGLDFQTCSRNLSLKESPNTYWEMARKYDIENKLHAYCDSHNIMSMAIQGEIIGEGINKNIYQIKDNDLYVFNVFNVDAQRYLSHNELVDFTDLLDLKMVPTILFDIQNLGDFSVDDILKMSEGKSVLNPKVEREGLVFKNQFPLNVGTPNANYGKISFKVINNKHLLKYGED